MLGIVLVVLSTFLATTAATASESTEISPTPAGMQLSALAETSLAPSRTASLAGGAAATTIATPTYRQPAPVARPRTATRTIRQRSYSYVATARRSTALRKISTRTTTTTSTKTSSSGELSRARAILAEYIAKYPICRGATVYFGKTPAGSQGCVYLASGTIVISPNHVSSLSFIIGHEIEHLRQYRMSH